MRALLAAVAFSLVFGVGASEAQVGRTAAEALEPPPLTFRPPAPEVKEVAGVPVLYLREPSVPLTTVFARFKGGYGRLGRPVYGAATALPSLLRYGGTADMLPDSVDEALEFYAIQSSFGSGGGTVFSSVNTLTEHLETTIDLWGDMLREPAFDSSQVEIWRGRAMESVRRRTDDPQRLAFSEFNRLLYGDHPIGWEMEASDLEPSDVNTSVLHDVHRRIVCPENLTLGVTGDAPWDRVEPLLEAFLDGWPTCTEPLPPAPIPDIRREPGVFLIPRKLEQSVLVLAHPTDVRLGDEPDYFAAQIGNSILGAGGFSSRLLSRVRTEEGYAYSAASLWTTPRNHEGLVGAVTRTRPENTVPAIRLILDIMGELRDQPPKDDEVTTAVDQIVNGFVFNFESTAQIVSRRMFYLAQDLPEDWLERYMAGVQDVTPEAIQAVFQQHLEPEQMMILVVGDPERIGREALAELGPVRIIELPLPPG